MTRRLALHAAALSVVLVAVVPLADGGAVFSADEGAALAQANQLAEEGRWTYDHPFPEVDPDSQAVPLDYSPVVEGQAYVPLAKHAAYPALLSPFVDVAGAFGARLVSITGTVLAAIAAALLVRRARPELASVALWATGLGTPLLFDSQLVMAHTLAAGLGGLGVVAALRAIEQRAAAWAVVGAVLLAATVLLRTEASILVAAVAAAIALEGVARRRVVRGLAVAATIAVVGFAARELDARLEELAVPGRRVGFRGESVRGDLGFLPAQLKGFGVTWWLPGYGDLGVGEVLSYVSLLVLAVLAWKLRRGTAGPDDIRILAGAGAAAAVLRLVVAAPEPVPGLVLSVPVAVFGLLLLERRHATASPARPLLVASALFAGGVLATQYAKGGAGEWGGRYFALLLPLLVPVVVAAIAHTVDRLAAPERRMVLAGLVATTAALAVLAVAAQRDLRSLNANLLDNVEARAAAVEPGDGGTPVVVTASAVLPRFAWDELDDVRWLLARGDDALPLLDRLGKAGVDRVVYVARKLEDRGRVEDLIVEELPAPSPGWLLLVLDPGAAESS